MNMQELLNCLTTHPKKHLIFDFDQTLCALLVDWHSWRENIVKFFQSYEPLFQDDKATHFCVQENYFITKYGPGVKKGIDEITYDAEQNHSQGFVPRQELIAILPELKKKHSFSIWSLNSRLTIGPILGSLGLEKYFNPVVTTNDVQLLKPEVDGFRLIHAQYNYPLSDYLMIGDAYADEKAAKNSGIDFFNVLTKEFIKAS